MIRHLALLGWLAAGASLAAVLEGVVAENRSGRPLARATVSLLTVNGGRQVPHSSTRTDSSGHFSFPNLPAGVYFISARREGLLPGHYGGAGSGAPIVLEAQTRFTAEVRLLRAGALNGEVLDENLVGLPGSEVVALRQTRTGLEPAGTARSDDRGVFRIPGLAAGNYLVRTSPRQLEDGRALMPTYLGQTADGGEARPVPVLAESEQHAGAIQPIAGKLARLRGSLPGGAGTAVTLYADIGARSANVTSEGAFEFGELAPAEYELLARNPDGRAAWTRLRVAGEESQVALALAPAPTVHIRVAGARAHAVATLTRRGLARDLPSITVASEMSGTGLPGEYGVAVETGPDTCLVSVEPSVAVLKPGESSEITVTLSDRPAGLHGKVALDSGEPAPGAPVFVWAADDAIRALIGGARQTRAGDDGAWKMGSLPPGKYFVFSSLSSTEPGASSGARSTILEAGGTAQLDLVLTP